MCERITLNNIIRKVRTDGLHLLPTALYSEATDAIRQFLLDSCRSKNSKLYRMISTVYFPSLKAYGIYGRIVYHPDTKEVEYIAGQDYHSELSYIKSLIRKDCSV